MKTVEWIGNGLGLFLAGLWLYGLVWFAIGARKARKGS